jgi:excisionase family DNA binding protein
MSNEPLLLKVPEAAAMLGLGRSTLYERMMAGDVPVVRIGRSVRISARALRAYADRLEAEQA